MDESFSRETIDETKLAIVEALNTLSKSRPFAHIAVTDIAKEAGIGRSSFYYHFSDRNDAVQWLSKVAFAQGIDRTGRGLTWFEGHYATTRMLFNYRPLITAAAEDSGYTSAELFYRRHRKENLCETLVLGKVELTEELAFQAQALAASEQVMTISFIRGNYGDMTARTFCELLDGIVPLKLHQAIDAL